MGVNIFPPYLLIAGIPVKMFIHHSAQLFANYVMCFLSMCVDVNIIWICSVIFHVIHPSPSVSWDY